MAGLADLYNDCARELHSELSGQTRLDDEDSEVLKLILQKIVEAKTPQQRKSGFTSLQIFYKGHLHSQNNHTPPDMAKARTIIAKHFTL